MINSQKLSRIEKEYLPLIEKYSQHYKIPITWALALIKRESSFRYDAINVTDPSNISYGLTQILLPTARAVLREDLYIQQILNINSIPSSDVLFSPVLNIIIGFSYFAKYMDKGSAKSSYAHYNSADKTVTEATFDRLNTTAKRNALAYEENVKEYDELLG